MTHEELETIARRRAAAKLGWYIHAAVYVGVNLLVASLAFASGRSPGMFPALGWGLGLAVHGLVVFLASGGAGLHEKLVSIERSRLALQRDPW